MPPRFYGEKSVEFALGGGEDLNPFMLKGFSLPYQKLIQYPEFVTLKMGVPTKTGYPAHLCGKFC